MINEPLYCSQGGIPYNKAHLDAKDAEIRELGKKISGWCLTAERQMAEIADLRNALAIVKRERDHWHSLVSRADRVQFPFIIDEQSAPLIHVGADGQPHAGPRAECTRCNDGQRAETQVSTNINPLTGLPDTPPKLR